MSPAYDSPLRPNAAFGDTEATMKPPSAGPAVRAKFIEKLSSAIAADSSRAGTCSVTADCHAGWNIAPAQPPTNMQTSRRAGVIAPAAASATRHSATENISACDSSITVRRSHASAATPDSSANSAIGKVNAVCTSETIVGDGAIDVISHDAATV